MLLTFGPMKDLRFGLSRQRKLAVALALALLMLAVLSCARQTYPRKPKKKKCDCPTWTYVPVYTGISYFCARQSGN